MLRRSGASALAACAGVVNWRPGAGGTAGRVAGAGPPGGTPAPAATALRNRPCASVSCCARTARSRRATGHDVHLHHVSTDEVFGSLGATGFFVETTAYDPRSPYSASKAASDHLVRAYAHTYGLSTTLSNCSNNYGPYQFPEKLIPLMIANCLEGKALPVYGDGQNVRDWLYVDDHAEAVWLVVTRAAPGTSWNVGGRNEMKNLDLLHELIAVVARQAGKDPAALHGLITFVKDRPGHDRRYAIDCGKIERLLGWAPRHDFAGGLEETVRWTLANRAWIDRVRSGAYREWIDRNYATR